MSRKKIYSLVAAIIIAASLIILKNADIEKSLHPHSPFKVCGMRFALMSLFYILITAFTIYFLIVRAIVGPVLKSGIILSNNTILTILGNSFILKCILYYAQFTGIYFLFQFSAHFNLHIHWYSGATPNYTYHFFAWEIIFLIGLLLTFLLKLTKRKL